MIKILFFDFDGTISDARSVAFKSLMRTLDEYGYEFDRTEALRVMGDKMQVILKQLGISPGHLEGLRRRFYKHFMKGALDGGIKLCVSVKPLYELKEEGIPLIVVSNSETPFLRASIRKLGLKGLFKKVYGAERFGTKDEMLERLFKEYKVRPCEVMYIGDRFSDIEYARDAGCYAVAIHNKYAWSSLQTIKKEKPDYIIKDFRGLKRIVQHLNEKLD
jgi:phosphoglycolate phosphatase